MNPRRVLLVLSAMLLAALPAALAQEDELTSPKLRIEWSEFKKLHDAGKVEVVDVRGEEAFAAGHIPGSRSIHVDQVGKQADSLKKLKKPIVTYCS